MNAVRDYARPASLEAALALLARPTPVTRPLAGGTYLALAGSDAEALIDLAGLGLASVSGCGERVTLGAMTTLQALVEASELCPSLRHAAEREASRNIRQQATLGGCVALGYGGPLLTCLLALDSELALEPGNRALLLPDYLAQRRAGGLADTLIVSLGFRAGRRLGYAEIVRTPADAPVLCVAVGAQVSAGRLAQVTLACSGAGQPLVAGLQAAAELEGVAVEDAAGRAAGVAWNVTWVTDGRAQAAYRQSMHPVLVRRAVANLTAQL
jgi:carbon-monoxide dehydrogenase medium subunit